MSSEIKTIIIPDLQIEFLKEALTFVNKNNLGHSLVIYSDEQEANIAKEYGADFLNKFKYGNYIDKISILLAAIKEIYIKYKFDLLILPTTTLGFELGPRVAHRIGGSYLSNVIGYEKDSTGFIFKKLIFSGVGVELLRPKRMPLVLSIKEGFEEPLNNPKASINVLSLETLYDKKFAEKIKLVKQEEIKAVDISNADKLVVIGRGLKSKEDLKIIKEFASLIKAEIGGSRPIVTDYKWLEDYRQVGLSGKTVRPKLYIGIGVSGQIHHIMGMKDSKTIVAINKDPNAPIKEYADYFIKGDLYVIVPALIKELSSQ